MLGAILRLGHWVGGWGIPKIPDEVLSLTICTGCAVSKVGLPDEALAFIREIAVTCGGIAACPNRGWYKFDPFDFNVTRDTEVGAAHTDIEPFRKIELIQITVIKTLVFAGLYPHIGKF